MHSLPWEIPEKRLRCHQCTDWRRNRRRERKRERANKEVLFFAKSILFFPSLSWLGSFLIWLFLHLNFPRRCNNCCCCWMWLRVKCSSSNNSSSSSSSSSCIVELSGFFLSRGWKKAFHPSSTKVVCKRRNLKAPSHYSMKCKQERILQKHFFSFQIQWVSYQSKSPFHNWEYFWFCNYSS